jgi:phospholipase/carboxylesterase
MVCPQGPLESPIGGGNVGYAWYPMTMGGPPDIEAMRSSRKALQDFLDECVRRYPIDVRKLSLLGFSQGGVMAYGLGLAEPQRFAALAALSSWVPPEFVDASFVGEEAKALPILVQHGSRDSMIEIGRARDSVERLRRLHVPVTYREYDMDHEITPRSLTDLSAWLQEKVLSPIVLAT